MAKLAKIVLVLAGLSLLTGIISRLSMTPIAIAPNGLEAQNFLDFTNICLLAAIALILLGK
ncbi:hypothetical protein ACFL5X_03520 [Candidatus Omnitrophota bacterium]